MKKVLILLLVACFALSLAACGISSNLDVQQPSNVEPGNQTQPVNQDDPSENAAPTEVTITETVLMDESGIKITAKSLKMDSLFGPQLKLLIENNSDKDWTVQCGNASVNGYMVDTTMSVDVAASKKANDELTFSSSSLELCGIENIADMEFSFRIVSFESWSDSWDSQIVQLKTSIADSYNYTYDDSGDLAYEGNDIKVTVKGMTEDSSIFGPSLIVYIENNSGKNITVQTRDVSVNGFMVDTIFSTDVTIGKHAIDTITFMDSDLEENEITSFEEVELSFHIFESDGWDTIVDTEVVKITF